MNVLRAALLAVLITGTAYAQTPTPWDFVGPGGGGAFTYAERGPAGTVLVAGDLGGMWRSTDNGASWSRIGKAQSVSNSHVISIGWVTADIVLACTNGDQGMIRSTDGGQSWTSVQNMSNVYLTSFCRYEADPSVIFAVGAASYNGTTAKAWKSTDSGSSWSALADPPSNGTAPYNRPLKITVHPTDSSKLWVVSGRDKFVPAGGDSLWQSTDSGSSWSLVNVGAPVLDFAIKPDAPGTMIATTRSNASSTTGDIRLSTNGGSTWSAVASYTGCVYWRRDSTSQVLVINVAKDYSTNCTDCGTFRSTDSGANWSQIANMSTWEQGWSLTKASAYGPGLYGICKSISRDWSGQDSLYWVTSRFLWKSADHGRTFHSASTETTCTQCTTRGPENSAGALAIDAYGSIIYAGYYDLGLWKSTDTGASWTMVNQDTATGLGGDGWKGNGGNTHSVAVDWNGTAHVFAAQGKSKPYQHIVRSVDAGSTWQLALNAAGTSIADSGFVRGLAVGNSNDRWATIGGAIYKSSNDGVNWSNVKACTCYTAAVSPVNKQIVFVGGGQYFWRLTPADNGTFKAFLPPGGQVFGAATNPHLMEWEGIHSIRPHPDNAAKVLATVWSETPDGAGGVYASSDTGRTWTRIRAALYMRDAVWGVTTGVDTVWASQSQPSYSDGTPAATGEVDGVVRLLADGTGLTSLRRNLPWPWASALAVTGTGGTTYLLAGLHGYNLGRISTDFGGGGGDCNPPGCEEQRSPPARMQRLATVEIRKEDRWYDVAGRRVQRPTGPGIWFVRHANGTSRRIVVLR